MSAARIALEWESRPGTFSHVVAGYSLRSIDGVPFTGYGLTITEFVVGASSPELKFAYHAANRRTYFCATFAAAEAGIRRLIRALRTKGAAA